MHSLETNQILKMSTKLSLNVTDSIQRDFFVHTVSWLDWNDKKILSRLMWKNRKIHTNNFNLEVISKIRWLCILWCTYEEIAWNLHIHPRTLFRRRKLEPEFQMLINKRQSLNSIYHRMNIVIACQSWKKPEISMSILKHERKKSSILSNAECPHCTLRYVDEPNKAMSKHISNVAVDYMIDKKAMEELVNCDQEALSFIKNRIREKALSAKNNNKTW